MSNLHTPTIDTVADDDDELIFADDDAEITFADDEFMSVEVDPLPQESEAYWKVIVVDDDEEVHKVTRFALRNFRFQEKRLHFVSAYSGQEAKSLIQSHPDAALMLLDVVMETTHSGLDVAKYIRQELNNQLTRIVLRTGQPGHAPEETVMIDYDINDYRSKAELTTQRLLTTIIAALRAFHHLLMVETHRREFERIAAASARFVPQEFLQVLQKESIVDVELGDQVQREMTIMFADVRSFTSMSENMSPQENFAFINNLLSQICPIVRQHHGFIDKYLGDGIMALFSERADDAVEAAVAMRQQLSRYNEQRQAAGEATVQLGIGLHTGVLMLGTIGEAERMEGTVISDAVNLAARVEGLTKHYGADVVISQQTLMKLDDPTQYDFRFIDRVKVKGKQVVVSVFEVLDGSAELSNELKLQTKSDFEQGLLMYHNKQFPQASVYFDKVLQQNRHDEAARLYLQRSAHYMVHGVSDDWEGVEVMVSS